MRKTKVTYYLDGQKEFECFVESDTVSLTTRQDIWVTKEQATIMFTELAGGLFEYRGRNWQERLLVNMGRTRNTFFPSPMVIHTAEKKMFFIEGYPFYEVEGSLI